MPFSLAPELVIYDNGCNLHNYCLNREPVFFKPTWFVVDRFHWPNHVGELASVHIPVLYSHLIHLIIFFNLQGVVWATRCLATHSLLTLTVKSSNKLTPSLSEQNHHYRI